MKLFDYYSRALVATFEGSNTNNKQLQAWLSENGYKIHSQSGSKLLLIK